MNKKTLLKRAAITIVACVCAVGLFTAASIAYAYSVHRVADINSVDTGHFCKLSGFSSSTATEVTHSSNIAIVSTFYTGSADNPEVYNLPANSAVLTGVNQTSDGWLNLSNTWLNYKWSGIAMDSNGRLLDLNMNIVFDKVYRHDTGSSTRLNSEVLVFHGTSLSGNAGWRDYMHGTPKRISVHSQVTMTFSYHDGSGGTIPDGRFVIDDIDAFNGADLAADGVNEIWQLVSGFEPGVYVENDSNVQITTTSQTNDTLSAANPDSVTIHGDSEHNSIPQDRAVVYTTGNTMKFNITIPKGAASAVNFGGGSASEWFTDLEINKNDNDWGNTSSQGNGNLVGAKFDIINNNGYAILVQVPSGGDYDGGHKKLVPAGGVCTTLTIGSNNKASTSGPMLPHGSYIIREVQAPTGYRSVADRTVTI